MKTNVVQLGKKTPFQDLQSFIRKGIIPKNQQNILMYTSTEEDFPHLVSLKNINSEGLTVELDDQTTLSISREIFDEIALIEQENFLSFVSYLEARRYMHEEKMLCPRCEMGLNLCNCTPLYPEIF